MSSISVEIVNPPDEALAKVAKGIGGSLERGMLLAAEIAAGEVRRAIRARLRQHTGALGRSYRATMLKPKRKGQLRSGAVSDLVYARIQDEGGTVTAKKRFLTIPVSEAAKRHSRGGGRARQFLDALGVRGRARARAQGVVHYAFKRSVRIPASGYLDAAQTAAEPQIAEIVDVEIQKGVDEGE
jgi:hypothetical protein